MKTILVPTDFSVASITAFRYALALANDTDIQEVRLVSVYQQPINFRDDAGYIGTLEAEKSRKICEARLIDFINVENARSPLTVLVTHEAIHGEVTDGIVAAACHADIQLIVLGKSEENDALDKWLGRTATAVAQKATRPILLVLEGTQYAPIKHILYTCDFLAAHFDLQAENVVAKWAKQLGAHVDVLFVKNDEEDYSGDEQIMREIFKIDAPGTPLSISVIESDSTVKAIQLYAKRKASDMIVVATEERGFFKNLFHKSVSNDLALHFTTPLLVLHAEDWKGDKAVINALSDKNVLFF